MGLGARGASMEGEPSPASIPGVRKGASAELPGLIIWIVMARSLTALRIVAITRTIPPPLALAGTTIPHHNRQAI